MKHRRQLGLAPISQPSDMDVHPLVSISNFHRCLVTILAHATFLLFSYPYLHQYSVKRYAANTFHSQVQPLHCANKDCGENLGLFCVRAPEAKRTYV